MQSGDIMTYRVDPAVQRIWVRFRRSLRQCSDTAIEASVMARLEQAGGTGRLLTGSVEPDGTCLIRYRLVIELMLLDVIDLARDKTLTDIARREKAHAALLLAGI